MKISDDIMQEFVGYVVFEVFPFIYGLCENSMEDVTKDKLKNFLAEKDEHNYFISPSRGNIAVTFSAGVSSKKGRDIDIQELIEEAAVSHLLSLVAQTDDEYQKGMLYTGLVHYKEEISKFSDDAKALIAAHLTAELKRYLNHEQFTADCINSLELIADVCRYFADSTIIELLQEVLKQGYNNINYYATDTLLSLGQNVPTETIVALANNLEYANLTYGLLIKFKKQDLFPKECSTPEYLAKSDMVHWLMYPTELGKEPDEIEYIGKITYLFKKEVYYVFKYRSNSDTLDDNLKNKWLIGWSSEDGGTFSNFDEYALYEKNTIDATLKNIKKKLIG
jgi:bacterioferritin (cytochrome b1)